MSSASDAPDSDYDFDDSGMKPSLPALPVKAVVVKRKAGGTGRKVKHFATKDVMMELIDEINSAQESKIQKLVERDV